eukprot:3753340-Rhodomonas_salina.1
MWCTFQVGIVDVRCAAWPGAGPTLRGGRDKRRSTERVLLPRKQQRAPSLEKAKPAGPFLPWGIRRYSKKTERFEASFRLPKNLLRTRDNVRSEGKAIRVRGCRRMKLGRVSTVEEAMSMQTKFIDGLEDKKLAQELRR